MDNTKIAAQWRDKTGRMTGVVIVFEGEVAEWMDALRNPEHWEPGCVAIDEFGRDFVAAGGNSRDGAKIWFAAIGQAPLIDRCWMEAASHNWNHGLSVHTRCDFARV